MCLWGTPRPVAGMHESGRDPSIDIDKGQLCYPGTLPRCFEIGDTVFVGQVSAWQCESKSIRVDGETGIRWEEGRRR